MALGVLGATMLARPDQFHLPVYDRIRPSIVPLGLFFAVVGLSLAMVEWRRSGSRCVRLAAHLAAACALLLFGAVGGPLDFLMWSGIAFYGAFGLAVAALPWVEDHLDRLDPGSLRLRLALIMGALATLPLVAVTVVVADGYEQASLSESLRTNRIIALSFAQDVGDYLALHPAEAGTLPSTSRSSAGTPDARPARAAAFAGRSSGAVTFGALDATSGPAVQGGAPPLADLAGRLRRLTERRLHPFRRPPRPLRRRHQAHPARLPVGHDHAAGRRPPARARRAAARLGRWT
ncbi:MAG TPA: hypothetical protein VFC93_09720 [Chloroflexota bacterium]|nr:hypothetical protein [Chloroflexota bacterium]